MFDFCVGNGNEKNVSIISEVIRINPDSDWSSSRKIERPKFISLQTLTTINLLARLPLKSSKMKHEFLMHTVVRFISLIVM